MNDPEPFDDAERSASEAPADAPAPPDPWPEWAYALKPRDFDRSPDLPRRFIAWMNRHAPGLLAGDPAFANLPHSLGEQRERLCDKARNAKEQVVLADWWDRLVSAGNSQQRWQLPLPPPLVRLPSERPAFVRADFQLLQAYRAAEAALLRTLGRGVPNELLHDAWIVAAVMFGGVLSPRMLTALLNLRPEAISGLDSRLMLMLKLDLGQGVFRMQRWFPDALSAALLIRLMATDDVGNDTCDSPERALTRLHEATLALGLPTTGDNRRDLMHAAFVAQSLLVSPMVSAYQAGHYVSHSLPDDAYRRLCGWARRASAPPTSAREAGTDHYPWALDLTRRRAALDPTMDTLDQRKIILRGYAILRQPEPPAVPLAGLLAEYSGRLWPITLLLLEWARWLLHKDEGKPALAASSVLRYLGAIARHLVDVVETEDPLEIEPEDLEFLYETAAQHVRQDSERGVFWARIRGFHDFLYLLGAPQVDLAELDGYEAPGEASVSANLVSEQEYQRFKDAVIRCSTEPDKSRLLLVAMLGFRCGLRRREIQILWLHDIHPGADPYLIVRASRLAALKSHASQRRLPLKALLPEDELERFMAYVDQRKALLQDYKGLLFARANTPRVPMSSYDLFQPVTEAFQCILGESTPRFRFHHLRHAFANWTFLALLAADEPRRLDRHWPLFDTPLLDPRRTHALKQAFFPTRADARAAISRRYLYQVSTLLGHLSPKTTLRSYLHTLDWLSGQETELALVERLAGWSAKELANVCGLSPSMPYKDPYRSTLDDPVAFLRRFVQTRTPSAYRETPASRTASVDLAPILARGAAESPVHPVTMMILLARRVQGEPWVNLEQRHGISAKAMERAWLAYRRMYAKQSVKHPKTSIPLPEPPRTRSDRREFWRIIDACHAAYASANHHADLKAAADALIRRTGPSTGRLYPGNKRDQVERVVRGLMYMGLPPSVLRLEVRIPEGLPDSKNDLVEAIDAAAGQGVHVEYATLNWPERPMLGSQSRLEITDRSTSPGNPVLTRRVGRIRAINIAAAWIYLLVP